MSDYKVIAEAGETLIQVLWTAINADADLRALIGDPSLISLELPAEHVQNKDAALLSIYLYQIKEDPYLKNRNPVEGPGGLLQRAPDGAGSLLSDHADAGRCARPADRSRQDHAGAL